jgi:hypothetical protein
VSDSNALRAARAPGRIVCLTEEPTEILYGLGEEHRIVDISAFTERPPEARRGAGTGRLPGGNPAQPARGSGCVSTEIESAIILQPGPAALSAGLDRLEALLHD